LAPSQARTQGYLDAMAERGLPVPDGYIIDTADARRTGFQSQIDQFMSLNPRPTAMACASDRVCIEFMRRLFGAGLRVPDDVALGGFEDLDVASIMIPRLTTIHAPRQELGREAVRLLIQRLDNPSAPVEHRVLKTTLVVRESCGSGKA
jgi:LacI family transcriptional regulator